MAKAIAFMLVAYLIMAVGVGILAGGGGVSATDLTLAVDDDDVTLQVTSTSGFATADDVVLGGEKIAYTGKTATTFTGCTRGYGGSTPAAHSVGATVYSTSANVINSAMGFNVASTVDSMGMWSILVIPAQFLVFTLPHLLMMPYQLFSGDLMLIAIFLVLVQVAIGIVIALQVLGARRV